MSGHNGTYNGTTKPVNNESLESISSTLDCEKRLHELQIINNFLIETSQVEDIDRICRLIGEAVHELNKDCYVIASLYDSNINAIRIRAAIGIEDLTEKIPGISGWKPEDISFTPQEPDLNRYLLTSGKLEYFKGGLYALLAKKVPCEICKKIETNLNIGSILVTGLSKEENVFGSISILVPEGKKFQNVSAVEILTAHASNRIQAIRTKKALFEAEKRLELLLKKAPLSYQSLEENGYFIDVNDLWLETLGYSWEEVSGKRFGDFLTPECAEAFKNDLFKFKFKLLDEIQSIEYEAIRKDGKKINIVVDGKIEYDGKGNFKQAHCFFKEITAHKEAERKALENEKLLRSMMDAITESAILVKSDGIVTYINETAAKRLKTTQEECIGRRIESSTSEEVMINRKKMFAAVLAEGKSLKFEDIRDGINFLNNLYPVYDSTNKLSHFAIFSIDITEYKKSVKEVKWELAVSKTLAELADSLIDPNNSIKTIANLVLSASQELTGSEYGYASSVDPETGDNVCHTLTGMMENCSINESAKRITFSKGFDGMYPKLFGHALNTKKGFYTNFPKTHPSSGGVPKGHISMDNFLSVPAIVGEELMGQISLANSKQGYSDCELEAIRKVAAIYALAIQQKRALMEIRYRDNILKAIFESAVDGIFVVDNKQKILFLNSKLVKMLRMPDSLADTQNYEKLLAFVLDQVKSPEEYLLKGKALFRSKEIDVSYIDFKDGRVFERFSTPLISNGILKGRVLSFRDVTEKMEAEKALINAKIHAEEANRTKSEFLATMSHELRTPLNSVIGYSDTLRSKIFGPLNERQLKYLTNISISGNHLLNLINDILDISRIESGDISLFIETVYIEAIFEDVKNIAIPLATSKNISLEFSAKPSDMSINVDKIKLKQVLHNLVNNALKFTPENGHVKVEARKSRSLTEISVRDDGIGIPEDKLEIIFEPFKQIDSSLSRKYSGTGLGLMIVKKFVEMHGGEIRVKSELTKGSTFTILLPVKRNS